MIAEMIADLHTRRYVRKVIKQYAPIQDVDDILQDSLLIALQSAHRYKPGNIRAWCGVIARRHVGNMRRLARTMKRRHSAVSVREDDHPTCELDFGYCDELKRAIEELPDDRKEILFMVMDGLTYHEIAERLNLPIGTVMSRLQRAREKIRPLLGR